LLVLDGGGGDNASGDHKFFPGLGEVKVVDTFLVALVDVGPHHFGAVLGSNVNLKVEKAKKFRRA